MAGLVGSPLRDEPQGHHQVKMETIALEPTPLQIASGAAPTSKVDCVCTLCHKPKKVSNTSVSCSYAKATTNLKIKSLFYLGFIHLKVLQFLELELQLSMLFNLLTTNLKVKSLFCLGLIHWCILQNYNYKYLYCLICKQTLMTCILKSLNFKSSFYCAHSYYR